MTPKRIQPSSNVFDSHERRDIHAFDSSLEEIPLTKKRLKMDQFGHSWGNLDEQFNAQYENDQKDQFTEFNDLFGQQFQNLRACSFKTISKAGLDKVSLYGKNDVAQFEGQFQSGNNKFQFNRMSEQKLRTSEDKQKNRPSGSQRFIGFGSMNQFSKFQKKHQVADYDHFYPSQKNKRKESSIAGSLHTINTQMMNDIIEFNIKDENQIDEKYLKDMVEMALIKNVIFTCNLVIRFNERKGEERQFECIKLYKLLDVDGFSITGFYSQVEKMRINLCDSITNKQFQKRMSPNSQTSISSQKHKAHHSSDKGVQFNGSFYRSKTYDYEQVRIFISDVKDLKSHSLKADLGERTSFDNIVSIPEAEQSVQMFGSYRNKIYEKEIMK